MDCKVCDNMYYIKLVNESCDDITYYLENVEMKIKI